MRRVSRRVSRRVLHQPAYRSLTPDDILARPFSYWKKTAITRIRPITVEDVWQIGPSFRDLEGRQQQVAIGRFLCVGVRGERWTCSQIQDRIAVSQPDAEGFIAYRLRDPQPVACFELAFPFTLTVHGKIWRSQPDGGVITWNGLYDGRLDMRLIARDIFHLTYRKAKVTK